MSLRERLIKSAGFKKNYGMFFGLETGLHCNPMIWSGMYCNSSLIGYLALTFLGYHSVLLAYTVPFVLDDPKLFGECAHFTVFRFSSICIIYNAMHYIRDLEVLFDTFDRVQVHDYENTLSDFSKTEINSIRRKYAERKHFYSNGFFYTVTGALAIFWLRTIVQNYFLHSDEPNGVETDGINRDLPVPSYFPYDTTGWPALHITLVCEAILVVQTYLAVIAYDCSFICFSEDFLCEMEIVASTLKDVYGRSEKLRLENRKLTQKESVYICVKHSIRHHQKIIDIFAHFYRYCYIVVFILLTSGAFLICLSGLVMTDMNISLHQKSVCVMFLGNELFHIFIMCYYGEKITEKSSYIGNCLYETSWMSISEHLKPFIIMINLRSNKPLAISGGGFMSANLDTYATVLRSAYSFLNLLKATA